MSDPAAPAKSPASRMLLELRAKKSQARRAGGATPSPSPSSKCAGVQQLLARQVKEEQGSHEEDSGGDGAPVVNTPRSLEVELENIKLETKEDEKLEDNKVEEEKTRNKIYAELILAREKLSRAKNQKEMLKELYEARMKNNVNMDWKDWSFAAMREEYVR